MARDLLTIIDEHAVVSCSVAEAEIHFSEPAAVAAWFGARYDVYRTTVNIAATRIEFRHRTFQWRPDQRAVLVDGSVLGHSYHAYLTLRGVIRFGLCGQVQEATEIWVHVELKSDDMSVAGPIRAVLRRGLHHLRSELDTGPK